MARATVVALALVGVLVLTAPAGAAKFKELGQPAPRKGGGGTCGSCAALQLATAASSPSYVVPQGDWKVVSWAARGKRHGKAEAELQIFRPTGTVGQYEVVGRSDVESFPAKKVAERKTSIVVEEGDHIGTRGYGPFRTGYDTKKDDDIFGGVLGCCTTMGSTVGPAGSDYDLNDIADSRVNVAVTLKRL